MLLDIVIQGDHKVFLWWYDKKTTWNTNILFLSVLMCCKKNFLSWFTSKKYVCIPRSFLVINVCNQGKTLCSPCIFEYTCGFKYLKTQSLNFRSVRKCANILGSLDSSVSILIRSSRGRLTNCFSVIGRDKRLLSALVMSRMTLGPTQPSVRRITGPLSPHINWFRRKAN